MKNDISKTYPIHWQVWENNVSKLDDELSIDKNCIDDLDLQGRTPLHLAILLRHLKCIETLIKHGASTSVQSTLGWSAVKEAICSGDKEIARLCVQNEYNEFDNGVPPHMKKCLQHIEQEPDIYFELYSHMKVLFFNVWSGRLRLWKKGASYRIDIENTTLLVKIKGDTATWASIDHKKKEYQYEETQCPPTPPVRELSEDVLTERLQKPVLGNTINIDSLLKQGLQKKSDIPETVNGYRCYVYQVPVIEADIKERSDHLKSKVPIVEKDNVKAEYYFNNPGMDIQPPMYLTTKENFTYKREANIWICPDHPISLKDHLMPILEMLSVYNESARGFREFFNRHVPQGCPVKATVEIDKSVISWFPVETLMENVFATTTPIDGVTSNTKNGKLHCSIADSCFLIPESYKKIDTQSFLTTSWQGEQ